MSWIYRSDIASLVWCSDPEHYKVLTREEAKIILNESNSKRIVSEQTASAAKSFGGHYMWSDGVLFLGLYPLDVELDDALCILEKTVMRLEDLSISSQQFLDAYYYDNEVIRLLIDNSSRFYSGRYECFLVCEGLSASVLMQSRMMT